VWNLAPDATSQRRLRVHITYLRRKIELVPDQPKVIVTEQGFGYRLVSKRTGTRRRSPIAGKIGALEEELSSEIR
jgi:hypothetical protein